MRCSRIVFVLVTILAVAVAVPLKKQVRNSLEKEDEPPSPPEDQGTPAPPAVLAEPPLISLEPIAPEPQLPELQPVGLLPELPPRRVISFDQRQEGKYNIRADLENFMIVVIPSSPSSGASLLDLLSRTNQKKSHHGGKYSHHKKYLAPSKPITTTTTDGDGGDNESARRVAVPTDDEAAHQYRSAAAAKQHFIEGRTPYHVDISSSSELQQQNRRLDAPLMRRSSVYGRSNSPVYRLLPAAAVDEVVAELPIKGNHAVTVLGVDGSGVGVGDKNDATGYIEASGVAGPRRFIRSLTAYGNQNEVNNNSVLNRGTTDDDASINFGDDESVASNRGFVDLTDTSNSFDSLNVGNVDRMAAGADGGFGDGDGWDRLTLLGAHEQCGPDRRRDSYGVCQFVPLD